jgi:hypothetical protein
MTSVPNTDQAIVQSNKWGPRRERNPTRARVRWPTGQVTQFKSEDADTQQDFPTETRPRALPTSRG